MSLQSGKIVQNMYIFRTQNVLIPLLGKEISPNTFTFILFAEI